MSDDGVVILLNDEPVPWRPLSEDERATLHEGPGNDGGTFYAFLLVEPAPGDYLRYDALPEGYEEIRVRWESTGAKGLSPGSYNMRIGP